MTAALPLLAVGAVVGVLVALAVDELEAVLLLESVVVELDEPVAARLVPLDDLLACPG